MRLGLCCTFLDEPIKFRHTTARFVGGKPRAAQRLFLGELALANADALAAAVGWCAARGIGAFRISSQLFPLVTHPDVGYALEELPTWSGLERRLTAVRELARAKDVRLSFHPDQFVVPGSASPAVVESSLAELEHHGRMAELVGAEQVTLHGGGAQPDKATALARLERGLDRLSPRARAVIALENDDRVFTVDDLLPVCARAGLPLIHDVHHHRCLPGATSVEDAIELAAATWGAREPWAHVSSPKGGWDGNKQPQHHDDFVRPADVPRAWLGRRITVDVEAKAKEQAVLRLAKWVATQERERAA
ncbi:UV DNA damage repair endonuclease UvsE [Nannocystis bainbridge]|uniref:UV DNA damage repair endonuclease UvsE n=1 Tax=Nannocystis bainbridge TaxID=2995303 RepID=A0ABT5EB95_9BACT|nr:UV DNA damage repair endonuclease UvsE [Nannocystis bainbridge]MDC0723142.1 UV DNA damage repair endonuclease UvsE [Nannocystis bainbridge]